MTAAETVLAVIIFALAGSLILLGIRHFRLRGFLLNNAWLYASQEERKTMDKKPYYRQSAVVFWLLSLVFVMMGLSVVLQDHRIVLLEIPVITAVIIYTVVSSANIRKKTGG